MDKNILQYTIEATTDLMQLEAAVKQGIANGWQPYGGISVTATQKYGEYYYAQVLVKYAE